MSTYGTGFYGTATGTYAMLGGSDETPPQPVIVDGPTRTTVSRVIGRDSSDITFVSDEAFTEYQVRIVNATTDSVSSGTLVEQQTINHPSATKYTVTISDDELVAAGALEGDNIIKIFVKDQSGNWSI